MGFETKEEFEGYLENPQPLKNQENVHRRRVFVWRAIAEVPGVVWWCSLSMFLIVGSFPSNRRLMADGIRYLLRAISGLM